MTITNADDGGEVDYTSKSFGDPPEGLQETNGARTVGEGTTMEWAEIEEEKKETPEEGAPEQSEAAPAPVKQSFSQAARSKALRPFVIISSSYLLFTITDGAMRMIVLLRAYQKEFSTLQVAIMFTLYEFASVFTNLVSYIFNIRPVGRCM